MSLTMSSSFCDKTFITAAIDSGRAGSWLLNLVNTLDLRKVALENLCRHHISILPYLCQKRQHGVIGNPKKKYSSLPNSAP
jgi:hypothetical protein